MPSLRPHAKHASRVCPFHSVSDGETLGVRETQSLVRVPWCICVPVKIPGFLVLLYHCSGCWGWNPALPSPGSPKSDALFGPKFDFQRSPSLSQGVRHLTKGRGLAGDYLGFSLSANTSAGPLFPSEAVPCGRVAETRPVHPGRGI